MTAVGHPAVHSVLGNHTWAELKHASVAEQHSNHICREWRLHYNRERPHEARGHLPPGLETPPEVTEAIRLNDVVCTSRLGGLLKHYEPRAA